MSDERYPPHLRGELRQVRQEMADAAEGGAAASQLERMIRAAFEHGWDDFRRNVPRMRAALGEEVDGGSFWLGFVAATFAFQNVDLIAALGLKEGEIIRQQIRKAREL